MTNKIVLDRSRIHTGHIDSKLSTLRRCIAQYLRYYSKFKIGITGNEEQRKNAHGRDGWRKMALIYYTKSDGYGQYAEYTLLAKRKLLRKYQNRCLNKRGGGAGIRPGYDHYYIYLLLK